MNITRIYQGDSGYPSALQEHLGDHMPTVIIALGNLDILQRGMLALSCSVRCPGHLILQTHDLAQTLRQADVTVISGFHSPVERECLTVLLRSSIPLVVPCEKPGQDAHSCRLPFAA